MARNLGRDLIAQARSGVCPKCGAATETCNPVDVHPNTPPSFEAYRCTSCPWKASVGYQDEHGHVLPVKNCPNCP